MDYQFNDINSDNNKCPDKELKCLLQKLEEILHCCKRSFDCRVCCEMFECLYPHLLKYLMGKEDPDCFEGGNEKYINKELRYILQKLKEILHCCNRCCDCRDCCGMFECLYPILVKYLKEHDDPCCCKGEKGDKGDPGPRGPVGSAGAVGPTGPQGPAGRDGIDGAQGPMGPAGPAGADGETGADGKSAYEVAVEQGFVGTEDEWLESLKGETGHEGPAGADGAQGPMGPAGPTGADGAQGPIGPAGPAGADGAQGPMGPAGPAGANGAQGPVGPAGPTGADGAQGPMGPAGPAGADGAQGPMGPAGPAGADGAQGPIGPAGPAGADGAQGPVGPEGPEGPQYSGIYITWPEDGSTIKANDKINGMGTPGCTVSVSVDGGTPVSVTVAENGRWSIMPQFFTTHTDHPVTATQTCPEGDTTTDNISFLTLPTCPLPVILAPIEGSTIMSNPLTVSGTAAAGATVMVCVNNATEAALCQNVMADASGEWSVTLSVNLRAGGYTATAQQISTTCNPNVASVSFAMDTPSLEPNPRIELISYESGQRFRTLDMRMRASGTPGPMTVHYLLMAPGMPAPTANEVIGYNNEEMLTTKQAVRGIFQANMTSTPQEYAYTLEGKEGITPYPLELGVLDGYNYNLYVACENSAGSRSNVISGGAIRMGMPFASGKGIDADPFIVRMLTSAEMAKYPDLTAGHPSNLAGVDETARLLDNIEGMQVLFDTSVGVHGTRNSLALSYRTEGDFSILSYETAWGGQGWRPIGNADPASLISGTHIFTGKFDTGAGTTISGLRIHATETPSSPARIRGLFGRTVGVDFRNITLPDPQVDIFFSSGTETGAIGSLAGYATGGSIEGVSLGMANVHVSKGNLTTAPAFAGGVAGLLTGTQIIRDIQIGTVTITENTPDIAALGGVAGKFDQAQVQTTVENIILTSAILTGSRNVGGVFGQVDAGINTAQDISLENVQISNNRMPIAITNSGGFAGLFTGAKPSTLSRIEIAYIQIGLNGDGTTGGLIGNSALGADTTINDCHVLAGDAESNGAFGTIHANSGQHSINGVAAALNTTNGNGFAYRIEAQENNAVITIDGCSVGSVQVIGGSGFTGYLEGISGAAPANVNVINSSVAATVTDGAGFVYTASYVRFEYCKVTGNVTGLAGFAQLVEHASEFVLCQVRGNVIGGSGFAGSCTDSVFDRCFVSGTINDGSGFAVQSSNSAFTDCYASGDVTSASGTAGFIWGYNSTIERCYASGAVSGQRYTAGIGDINTSPQSLQISNCIALNPSVSMASGLAGELGRVSRDGATLSSNYARADMVLTRGGVVQPAVSDPNGRDGQDMNMADLEATMVALGWDTVNVWDTSTIATLGRPTLIDSPEN